MEEYAALIRKFREANKKALKEVKDKRYYSPEAHNFLQAGAWELRLPLNKKEWPKEFKEGIIESLLSGPGLSQQFQAQKVSSHHRFIVAASHVPLIDLSTLRVGYLFAGGQLLPTMFFEEEGFFADEKISQTMAIDPCPPDITPEYYFGMPVEEDDLAKFIYSREDPLESFVKRNRNNLKKIIDDYFLELYIVQTKCDPTHFPEELIQYCQENGAPIPPQE